MDKLKKYKEILREELSCRAARTSKHAPDLHYHLVINKEETEFLLLRIGWHKKRYRYAVSFHFELKDNKVWLHQNGTDVPIGEYLIEKGIPKSDIVVGFVSPLERTTEGYALA